MVKFHPLGSLPCQRSRPSANATPSGTAIAVVRTPSSRVWPRAPCSVGSCHTDRFGSPQYQRNEKPCQVVRDLPALKENRIATATGSSDHARYSHVIVARIRGLRHGLRHQFRPPRDGPPVPAASSSWTTVSAPTADWASRALTPSPPRRGS